MKSKLSNANVSKLLGIVILISQILLDANYIKFFSTSGSNDFINISTEHILFYFVGFWLITKNNKFSLVRPIAVFSLLVILFSYRYQDYSIVIIRQLQFVIISSTFVLVRTKWTITKTMASFALVSLFLVIPALFKLIIWEGKITDKLFFEYMWYSASLMFFSAMLIVSTSVVYYAFDNQNKNITFLQNLSNEALMLISNTKKVTNLVIEEINSNDDFVVNFFDDNGLYIDLNEQLITTDEKFQVTKIIPFSSFSLVGTLNPRAP